MPFKDKHGRTCGFLDIDEDDKRKKFHRRFFILNKSCGVLEWYSDSPSNLSENAQPCGIVKLDYITKVDEAKKMKLDYLFVINTPFRQYYIQASSQRESEEWVETLNDASRIIVPPEAMNPQSQTTVQDMSSNGQETEDASAEADQTNCTYRTEIVGNVVVKKKIGDHKKTYGDEPMSPQPSSTDSGFSYQLTPDRISLQSGFFNSGEKDVIKKGWAVKQGHVEREPIRTIPIGEILAARHEQGELSRQRDNLFLVATTDKLYYIQTDTPDEMNSWIDAFNRTVKSSRHSSTKTKHQDNHREGTSFGGSTEPLNEPKVAKSLPPQQPLKQSQSIECSEQSRSSPIITPGNSASIDKAPKKHRKTHRRAESEVTALSAHALDVMSIPTGNALSTGVNYNAEDVKARPESVNLSTLADQSWILKSSNTAAASTSAKPPNAVATRLHSHVDTRAAIKPSAVKKKKNPGVLFSFNTMLTKKQDRIDREKARFTNK